MQSYFIKSCQVDDFLVAIFHIIFILSLRRINIEPDVLGDTVRWHIGYEESKYFIHVFKQQTGTTPLKYRKAKQGKQ